MGINHPDFGRKPSNPSATIALLAERFPNTFATELAKVRPLAIGISQTLPLFCPDIPSKLLRVALYAYCAHGAYLRALTEGAPRIDLDGAPSGAVTADAALHASRLIAALEAASARQAAEAKKSATPYKPAPHTSNPTLRATGQTAAPPPGRPVRHRLGLADLKAAAVARRRGQPGDGDARDC
jgi:ProP effector